MSQIDEYAAIPMNGEIIYDNEHKIIQPGEYLFTVISMKREQVERSEKMPNHINIKFQLKLETADGDAGKVWDNLRMYNKWLWKYAELAVSIGHTPVGSNRIQIDWSKFVGAQGQVQIGKRTWERNDGTKKEQNTFEYLCPPLPSDDTPDW